MIPLQIKRIRTTAILPAYQHEGDAGMDVAAAVDMMLAPGETAAIPTGLILHIPLGYEIQVRPRSGLSLKTRLRLPNAPGTIDSGYKDELLILMHNSSSPGDELAAEPLTCHEKSNRAGTYVIKSGDRIAQLVLAPVSLADIREESAVDKTILSATDRGGGFGSSGI